MIELVTLDRDHPGFRDPAYRKRRNQIAQLAADHQVGQPPPHVDYTPVETGVWTTALEHLAPLHERYACDRYRRCRAEIPLGPARIPQLAEMNGWIRPRTGLEMAPVAGLVSPRVFMSFLGRGTFLSTQYIRHSSAPLYTPEPDVVHELVGHAPLLGDPELAEVNRLFGTVTDQVDEVVVQRLIRVYWYTLEFGLLEEGGGLRAVGAGLLSSYGELGRFEAQATIRPLDLELIAETPFDPTDYQGNLFVAPSLEALLGALRRWLPEQVRRSAPRAATS